MNQMRAIHRHIGLIIVCAIIPAGHLLLSLKSHLALWHWLSPGIGLPILQREKKQISRGQTVCLRSDRDEIWPKLPDSFDVPHHFHASHLPGQATDTGLGLSREWYLQKTRVSLMVLVAGENREHSSEPSPATEVGSDI